uniref:RNA-binding protein 28 (inferred by orthology to a human protein) n=1 Tax=Strongyloides venezuelensis TaxID=75913 RepID=A0A0K0FME4_STRVS
MFPRITDKGNRISRQNHRGVGIKAWRLIVRNLPYKTKKSELEEIFKKYGVLQEIVLPSNKDHKKFKKCCAGFAFIQYKRREDAENALKGENFKELGNRKIAIDYSMDKEDYLCTKSTKDSDDMSDILKKVLGERKRKTSDNNEEVVKKIKTEEIETEKDVIKNKKKESKKNHTVDFKKEMKLDEELEDEEELDDEEELQDEEVENEEELEDEEVENEEELEDEEELENEEEMEETDDKEIKKEEIKDGDSKKTKNKEDKAVLEKRVIFVRNLHYDVMEEELTDAVSDCGTVELCIICRYKDSEHSMGTGFIHFSTPEEAQKCLQKMESTKGVVLENRRVAGYLAVPRKEASTLKNGEKKLPEKRDKRNLRLLKYGHIKKGTAQAKNMSEHDTKKRADLALAAKKKLKNPLMFVSDTRLVIHNIPKNIDDKKLHDMCMSRCGNKNGKITECRIWRERPTFGNDPKKGKSKGFGFVAFTEHKDALFCLKQMNNNPKLFTDEKRPIVEFCVENLTAIRAKEKRKEKSKQTNK